MAAIAVLGPRFATSTVYDSVAPAVTGSGESVSAIARSALASTVVSTLAVLFAATGSAVAASTTAVSVMVPPDAGAVTAIAIDGAAPGSIVAIVQVTSCPAAAHDHPAPVAL